MKPLPPPHSQHNGIQHNRNIVLSIIIISYNTKDITAECLRSIKTSEIRSPYEIIVVDNNSHDGSVEMIKEKFPDVVLIENKENKLFSKANNQGARIACGKYVLLLNSDTIVEDDNLQKMIDYFETLPDDVICIGPKILNKDGSLQSSGNILWTTRIHHWTALYNIDRLLPIRLLDPVLDRRPDKNHPTGWVAGCCMMMPRDKYLYIEGLNEKLIFYGEEPEFGYRTSKAGYRTYYYADAHIIHLGGASSKKQSFEENMAQYASLVDLTIGNKGAIRAARRMITSLRIKSLFYKNKDSIRKQIEHEKKSIVFFKNR